MHEFRRQYLRKDKEGKVMADYYDEARKHLLEITDLQEKEDDRFSEENILMANVKK
jgi:hypothetical protein